MPHASPLVVLLAAGLGLAFVLGTIAHRLRISPIVGYLLAGVAVGPFTPGYVADPRLTLQLAEIGVILLMFGVGLHFSLKDLLSVRATVLPGAFLQMAVSAALGTGAALLFGWPLPVGIVFGAALAIASTVVTTRALQERRLVESERGRIAVAWLVVQDVVTVLVLVLLLPLAPVLNAWAAHQSATLSPVTLSLHLVITLAKAAAFFLLMWFIGRRLIPTILHYVAHTGSRELFRLAVLAVALGVALAAAELFGVSIALGAFFAGMVLSESQLSRRAAEESLPLRDAFAVLFFVSVGMLFNPHIFIAAPLHLLAALAVVTLGTTAATFLILRALGTGTAVSLFVATSLAQIGEFSFVLGNLGISLKLLPEESRDLILGTSILSILLNPLLVNLADAVRRRLEPAQPKQEDSEELTPTMLSNHMIVVGFGRVGRLLVNGLRPQNDALLVIEEAPDAIETLRSQGTEALAGNGADSRVLAAANLPGAKLLFVAIPEAFEAGQIVQQARRANPQIKIVARAHFDAEVEHLQRMGADIVFMDEREIADAMLRYAAGLEPAAVSHLTAVLVPHLWSNRPMENPPAPTAAMLVIGDEILSGRTQDTNINYLARFLGSLGIDLKEARVVPDAEMEIVAAVNALRTRYDYIFTTGGIGPTHDDITADAIAAAFNVSIDYHPEALGLIGSRYKPGEFNEMRKRMARIPAGASLIYNSVSAAPGFQIENVFVMAGVPMIMRAMLEDVAPRLRRGAKVHTATVTAPVPEGRIAAALAEIQQANPTVALGSYPYYREDGYGVQLVVRGRDASQVDAAASEIESALRAQGFDPIRENA